MTLEGRPEYARQLNPTDRLSDSQRDFLHAQWRQFRAWWERWDGALRENDSGQGSLQTGKEEALAMAG